MVEHDEAIRDQWVRSSIAINNPAITQELFLIFLMPPQKTL